MKNKIALFIGLVGMASIMLAFQSPKFSDAKGDVHKVVVQEVLQVSKYTYLKVKDDKDSLLWLAVPTMQAEIGKTYYYKGGMDMKDFTSKELNRTFPKIIFIEKISDDPLMIEKTDTVKTSPHGVQKAKALTDYSDIKIKPAEGGITIEELFKNKDSYSGKTVLVRGIVTKFSNQIMKKNWIHVQDGTNFKGEYDLTATSAIVASVGDTITLEGKIALDKNFGFNYFYKVLMEEAVKK